MICDCYMEWIFKSAELKSNEKLYIYLTSLKCTVLDTDKYDVKEQNYTYQSFFNLAHVQQICKENDHSKSSFLDIKCTQKYKYLAAMILTFIVQRMV